MKYWRVDWEIWNFMSILTSILSMKTNCSRKDWQKCSILDRHRSRKKGLVDIKWQNKGSFASRKSMAILCTRKSSFKMWHYPSRLIKNIPESKSNHSISSLVNLILAVKPSRVKMRNYPKNFLDWKKKANRKRGWQKGNMREKCRIKSTKLRGKMKMLWQRRKSFNKNLLLSLLKNLKRRKMIGRTEKISSSTNCKILIINKSIN